MKGVDSLNNGTVYKLCLLSYSESCTCSHAQACPKSRSTIVFFLPSIRVHRWRPLSWNGCLTLIIAVQILLNRCLRYPVVSPRLPHSDLDFSTVEDYQPTIITSIFMFQAHLSEYMRLFYSVCLIHAPNSLLFRVRRVFLTLKQPGSNVDWSECDVDFDPRVDAAVWTMLTCLGKTKIYQCLPVSNVCSQVDPTYSHLIKIVGFSRINRCNWCLRSNLESSLSSLSVINF